MKSKILGKISIDIAMTVMLILLMAYELIGQSTHEWIGILMFCLFVLHHVMNRRWICNINKGQWTILRIWQTILVVWVLTTMIGSMISGIILSRTVFVFLPVPVGQSVARKVHIICAYWGLVGMSLHLGFHWKMILSVVEKYIELSVRKRKWMVCIFASFLVIVGIIAFLRRDIGSYMLLKKEYVFFNYEEPLILFFLDYITIMGIFVCIGHYFTCGLKKYR